MISFGTKAQTLAFIKGKLSNAKVLPQVSFTTEKWENGTPELFWKRCLQISDSTANFIVRSSAINEDTCEESCAGKFESVGHVHTKEDFVKAVHTVIQSFDDGNPENQILVQPMLEDVMISGVAFTIDPNSLGNYYVINFDEGGSTSAITSGKARENKLLYIFKGTHKTIYPDYLQELYLTLKELENLFEQNNLDVEFAITNKLSLYIFQVRPLCINGHVSGYTQQCDTLKRIHRKLIHNMEKKPYLCGNKTIYSVMSDWNPAEMIGIRPKPLALSLYKEMITDSVWAYQRDNYGYRNLRSFPLMCDFGGLPYIDIRVSFNSFVPAELDDEISNKLVNYYLERLAEEPAKHDKVEFDIVFSCYTLDIREKIQILKQYDFSESEIEKILEALRNVTNKIIDASRGLWKKDFEKICILKTRYEKILASTMDETEKIYWLLEDCKRYGTLPFAGLARGAFIAVQMLRSMEKRDVISQENYQDFMNDVETVSTNMSRDLRSMSKSEFLDKYGHLRPGTYDINSPRYDEAPDLYFDWASISEKQEHTKKDPKSKQFSLSITQMHKLKDLLDENGLHTDILGLMDFIKLVIEGREYGKFIFTRSLSKAIQLIGKLGEKYGLSREDCSYINIQHIRNLYSSAKDIEKILCDSVRMGRTEYEMTKSLVLPPIICAPEEIWQFYYPDTEPNYITLKQTYGETIELTGNIENTEIAGKIVLIECADPGYDWIFSHNIKAFITMYGGANSHMAIRAGELNIPAVIGVGEKQYQSYCKAKILEIDAMSKNVRIL